MKVYVIIVSLFFFASCKTSQVSKLNDGTQKDLSNEKLVNNEKEVEEPNLDKPIILKLKEIYTNSKNDFGISFQKVVNDSRCPKGVTCFHAGSVKIGFSILNGAGEPEEITLEKEEGENLDLQVYSNEKFTLKLLQVNPYPVSGKSLSPEDYSVKIIVSNN